MSDAEVKIRITALKDASVQRELRAVQEDVRKANQAARESRRLADAAAAADRRAAVARASAESFQQKLRQNEISDVKQLAAIRRQLAEVARREKRPGSNQSELIQSRMLLEQEANGLRKKINLTKEAARATEASMRAQIRLSKEAAAAAQRAASIEDRARGRLAASRIRADDRYDAVYGGLRRQHASRFDRMIHTGARYSTQAFASFVPRVPNLSQMGYWAGDLARGVGINVAPSQWLSNAVSMQSDAIRLSNAGIIPGDPDNSMRRDPRVFTAASVNVGNKFGLEASKVQAALREFQTVSGDTKLGLDLNEKLAEYMAGMGVDPTMGGRFAGNIAAALSTSSVYTTNPQKIEAIMKMLRIAAGQGKQGAVEVEHFARYTPRMLATLNQYQGDPIETFRDLGVLAQSARATGGASTPGQAANAIARLMTTFRTNARVEEFKAAGIQTYDPTTGLTRNPLDITREAIMKTRKDPTSWNKLFMNILGEYAPGGLRSVFMQERKRALDSGVGEERASELGMQAVDAMIEKLRKAEISPKDLEEAAKKWSEGTEANVNRLNNALDQIAVDTLPKFTEAIIKATPTIKKGVEKGAEGLTWMMESPENAGMALGALTLGAGVWAGVFGASRAATEKLLGMAAKGIMSGLATAGGAGIAALAGTAATIGAGLGVALYGIHEMIKNYQNSGDWKQSFLPYWMLPTPGQPDAINNESSHPMTWLNSLTSDEAPITAKGGIGAAFMSAAEKESPKTAVANQELLAAISALTAVMSKGLTVHIDMPNVPGGGGPGQKSSMSGAR